MDQIIGQIQPFGFSFAPKGWAFCDGTILSISSNTALFSLLGTTFGGDGRTTFALPDLRGRNLVHCGSGQGSAPTVRWGEKGGQISATMTSGNMPMHTHALSNGNAKVTIATTNNSNSTNESDNGGSGLGTGGAMPDIFRESPTASDKIAGVNISGQVNASGQGMPFDIRNPYVGIYVSIALYGVFPQRN